VREIGTTVLGYPRIGPDRELKRALERYWAHRIDQDTLLETGRDLRERTWRTLAAAGLDSVPSNTFSHYDHVLDTAALFGALPERFTGPSPLDTYFAAARGAQDAPALEMTKWFDTNYHYLVPELGPDTTFTAGQRHPGGAAHSPVMSATAPSSTSQVERPVSGGVLVATGSRARCRREGTSRFR
jgi:5-methyltetrahydropteroyltriglutamate--homocysteine methyltransferase